MKKRLRFYVLAPFLVILLVFSCNKNANKNEGTDTVIKGKATVLVDETLLPIVEDQLEVFQNTYDANIILIPKSEKESIIDLFDKKAAIIVLSRKLNEQEIKILDQKKIVPKTTKIATDAVAFIKSKSSNDTLVALNDVIDFVKGKKSNIKGLVFDNPNSSTTRYICDLAGISSLPEKGIYSFKTNDEVIKYVSQNDGLIGVVGINWILQPNSKMKSFVDKVEVQSVKGSGNQYVYPSQDALALGNYPLARDLYIINCQSYQGLGAGFSSFIAGERGQRIILKSGLLPVRLPGRKIVARGKI